MVVVGSGLAICRHKAEDYVHIGVHVYPDGVLEPYIIETGKPIVITRLSLDAPVEGAVTVKLTMHVERLGMYRDGEADNDE